VPSVIVMLSALMVRAANPQRLSGSWLTRIGVFSLARVEERSKTTCPQYRCAMALPL